ncbi:MAG: LysR family transcriptional regulator [Pseudomonadota bacterium]
MNLKGLRAFDLVMQHGSLSAAAITLNQSEPAVSRQISNLEAELGLKLFSRDKRSLEPTPEAEAFQEQASAILVALAQLPGVVADIKAAPMRRVRLASMSRVVHAVTTPAIAAFRAEHPDITLTVDIQPRRFLEQWVAGRQFDVAVGALPALHADVRIRPLLSVPAIAALPIGHPLAGRDQVTLADLRETPLIAMSPNTLIRRQTDQLFEQSSETPRPLLIVSQTQLACQLVARGQGYTICDPMVAEATPGIARIPILPRTDLSFGILTHRQVRVSAAGTQMEQHLFDAARDWALKQSFEGHFAVKVAP